MFHIFIYVSANSFYEDTKNLQDFSRKTRVEYQDMVERMRDEYQDMVERMRVEYKDMVERMRDEYNDIVRRSSEPWEPRPRGDVRIFSNLNDEGPKSTNNGHFNLGNIKDAPKTANRYFDFLNNNERQKTGKIGEVDNYGAPKPSNYGNELSYRKITLPLSRNILKLVNRRRHVKVRRPSKMINGWGRSTARIILYPSNVDWSRKSFRQFMNSRKLHGVVVKRFLYLYHGRGRGKGAKRLTHKTEVYEQMI